MKKIVMLAVALMFMVGAVWGQTTDHAFPKSEKNHAIKVTKLYWPAEDDKLPLVKGTANDTSTSYVFPDFREMWMVCKPYDATAQDSTDAYIILQVRAKDLTTAAGNTGIAWVSVDSTAVATADTAGGKFDEWEVCPPAYDYRVILDGVTGNDVGTGVTYPVWVVFKQ